MTLGANWSSILRTESRIGWNLRSPATSHLQEVCPNTHGLEGLTMLSYLQAVINWILFGLSSLDKEWKDNRMHLGLMLQREKLHIETFETHRKWMTVQSGWQPTQLRFDPATFNGHPAPVATVDISKYPTNSEIFWNYILFESPLGFLSQAVSVLTFSTFSSSTWANSGGGSQNFRCSKPSICTAGVCSKQCLDPWHYSNRTCPLYELDHKIGPW